MNLQRNFQFYFLNSLLRRVIPLLIVFQMAAGCSLFRGVTKYDALSYKSLTDLKPQVSNLYDGFQGEAMNQSDLDQVRLAFAQMLEYEKGKGPKNQETVDQAVSLQTLFEKHVKDRQDRGVWSSEHGANQKDLILEAFDIAISTEQLKNK